MRGRSITKILHPRQRVILFLVVWRVLTEKVWLSCDEFFFLFSLFLSHALEIHANPSNK
jgi:hypothetical protein